MDKIRAFIAVPLPAPLLDALIDLQHRLKSRVPHRSVRWVRSEGIHLTLKFLGSTPEQRLPEIQQALAAVARHAPACTFTAQGLGCFPNPRRPRVLWVGVEEPTGRLAALQAAIEEAMEQLDYERERRAFTPHLTLGRVRRRTGRKQAEHVGQVVTEMQVGELAQVSVDTFELIQSELKPSGAEYTTLKAFALQRE